MCSALKSTGRTTHRRWGPRTAYFADPGGHIYELVRRRGGAG